MLDDFAPLCIDVQLIKYVNFFQQKELFINENNIGQYLQRKAGNFQELKSSQEENIAAAMPNKAASQQPLVAYHLYLCQ